MDSTTGAAVAVAADTLFDAGLECMVRGDAPGAVDRFRRTVAIDPEHTDAAHGLIRALVDAGRVDEALETAQRWIAGHTDDVLAVTRLSMIYQQKGMIAEAEAAAAKAKILGWKMELRGGPVAKTDL